jgi:hypothetical protein
MNKEAEICPNCGTTLSCGCQKRVASNGALCCDQCIQPYEQRLIETKVITTND